MCMFLMYFTQIALINHKLFFREILSPNYNFIALPFTRYCPISLPFSPAVRSAQQEGVFDVSTLFLPQKSYYQLHHLFMWTSELFLNFLFCGQDKLASAGTHEILIPGNIVVLVTQRIRILSVAACGSTQLKH